MNNYLKYLTDFGDFLDEIKFGFVFDIRLVYVGFFFLLGQGQSLNSQLVQLFDANLL